jgi:phosphatidylserine/phosphatidylglycerophosphate/cardiolipin synthase-like enzyme
MIPLRTGTKYQWSLIALVLVAIVLITLSTVLAINATRTPSVVQEAGTVRVVMCPACEHEFLTLLRDGSDVTCALYDFGDAVQAALRATNARVLTDDEDGGDYGTRVRVNGLMHDKFCIINGSVVTSGSYNPTSNGAKSRNNLVIVNSPTMARGYRAEWDAIGRGGTHTKITHTLVLSDVNVTYAFCPQDSCEERVIAALDSARTEIRFMVFSFTSDAVADALVRAQARGVYVEGVCDRSQWNVLGGECASLDARRWSGEHLLHHKVFVIDKTRVITGSYNPTASGNSRNRENLLFITSNAIAQEYLTEYALVHAQSERVISAETEK